MVLIIITVLTGSEGPVASESGCESPWALKPIAAPPYLVCKSSYVAGLVASVVIFATAMDVRNSAKEGRFFGSGFQQSIMILTRDL